MKIANPAMPSFWLPSEKTEDEIRQEQIERWTRMMNDASKALTALHGVSALHGQRNGVEARYALAYQQLIKLGLYSQHRKKYR